MSKTQAELQAEYEAARQRWKAARDEMDEIDLKMTAIYLEKKNEQV